MGSVPIASNYDVPFVSVGCETGNVPIAPNAEDRRRHDPIRNESDSGTTRARTSRVVSQPSTTVNEPGPSNDCSLYSNNEIETGQIYANKKELQRMLAMYAMKKNFEFRVKKFCSQRFEFICIHDNCSWQVRATRIPNIELWAIKVFIKTRTYSTHAMSSGSSPSNYQIYWKSY